MDNEKQPQDINQVENTQNSQQAQEQQVQSGEQATNEQSTSVETAAQALMSQAATIEGGKKKKLSTAAKVAIGVAAALFLGGGVFAGVSMLGNSNISVVMDYGEVHNNKVVTQTVKKGTKIKSLPILDKEGWVFDGWYKDEACTDKYNNNTTLNEDVTVYGKYQIAVYVVTFHNDDGSVLQMFTEVEHGTDMTTVYTTIPSKTDKRFTYTFKNWIDSAGKEIDLSNIISNVSAYANYDKVEIDYSLTINNQSTGGIINVTRNDIPVTEQDKLHFGDELKISYIETDGYEMEQFVVRGATLNGDKYIVNGDVTINYSESVNKFSVIFYDENKTTVLHTINNLEYGDAAVYPNIPTKQSDGAYSYTFAGWTDINGNIVNLNYITGNLEVYVSYTAEQIEYSFTTNAPDRVTVTLDGKVLTPQDKFYYGDLLVIDYTPSEGHYCKQMIVTGATQNRTSYIVTGDVNINYVEEIYKFTVTYYDANKTTVLHTINDLEYGSDAVYETIPTKESDKTFNYTFDKWVDKDGNDAVFTNVTKDIDVYALYQKEYIEYSVTINNTSTGKVTVYNDLTLLQPGDTVHYGDKLSIYYEVSPNFVLKNFTVDGAILTGEKYVVNGNVTITYEESETFTVNYYNYDGSLIYSETGVVIGTESKYHKIPTREPDEAYEYTFKEWTDRDGGQIDLTNVTSNLSAYASYTSEYRKFALSVQNSTNAKLSITRQGEELKNGAIVSYNDVLVITYELTEGYSLVNFSVEGATQDGDSYTVTGNVQVIFSEAASIYTVNYYDEDKTTLFRSLVVGHGDAAVYSKIPTKDSDTTFTYTFAGWVDYDGNSVDLSCVKSDLDVYASYTPTYKEYSLTINNATRATLIITKNGVLQTSTSILHYGDKLRISYTTTEGHTMTNFKVTGATLEGDEYTVEDNVTVYYSEQINEYTVTYYDEDKVTVLYTLTGVDYNTNATYTGKPTKNADNSYTYKFDKWLDAEGNDAVLTNIKQDLNVYASYTATLREYTITLYKSKTGTVTIKKDGQVISTSDTVHYGDILEILYTTTEGYHVTEYSVTGATFDENVYTVTGSVTITYKEDINVYSVNFYDEDKETLLITKQVQHGSATYYNITKLADNVYMYAFENWTNFDGEVVDLISVTSDLNLCPKFTETYIEYTVTINKTKNSNLVVLKDGERLTESSTVHYGDIINITYTIREGWEFVNFSVENLEAQEGDNYSVKGNVVINFTEKVLTYNVTIYTSETDNAIYEVPRNLPIWENLPQLDPMENYNNEEYTCGFYTDSELRNFLPYDQILTGDMTLYTRIATLDKLSFKAVYINDSVDYYTVKAFNTTIPGDVVIPLKVKHGNYSIKITTMLENAFKDCKNMTSVMISHNITNIPKQAFSNCPLITKLIIPENIKTIDRYAIGDCENLIRIDYRATTARADYPYNQFGYEDSLHSNYYGSEDIYMIRGAQLGCKVTIGNNVTEIPKRMFLGSNIIQVEFETGSVCASIGKLAFASCENLLNLHLPSTIERIDATAFMDVVSVKNIYLDNIDQWFNYSFGNVSLSNYEYHNNYSGNQRYGNPLQNGSSLYVGGELLTDLVIPDTVKSINAYAFRNCVSLQTVTIPDGIETINIEAFSYCPNLTTVTIPASVKNLYRKSFSYCPSLRTININASNLTNFGESNMHYSDYSPFYMSGAETCVVNIGDTVTHISRNLFNNSNITSVQFSENSRCKTISEFAFYNCYKLESLTIPSSVESIKSNAFSSYLRELYNNSSLNINAGAYGLSSFVIIIKNGQQTQDRIFIKDSFKYLVKNSIYYMLDYVGTATDVVLPDTIDGNEYEIRDYAFYGCKLTSVTIPTTIKKVGFNAFANSPNLKKVYISDLTKWMQISFNSSNPLQNGAELYLNNELVTRITVPAEITEIKSCVFQGCISLISIDIPHATQIGSYAFEDCINLESIITPQDLKVIGYGAFYNCKKLKSIELPEGLTSISSSAFQYCENLIEANIPSTVTTIGSHAFYYCKKLTSDIVIPKGVTRVEDDTFYYTNISSLTFEQGALTYIGQDAFGNCGSIKEIIIPEGVTIISRYAFYSCSSLKSVTISSTVREIQYQAFGYCDAIETVYARDISNWATITFGLNHNYSNWRYSDSLSTSPVKAGTDFYIDGTLLTDAIIPDGVTQIGSYAFVNNKNLKSIRIPDTVESIGSYAFYGCSNLKDVTLSNKITKINYGMFYGCSSIESIVIPSSLTSVDSEAFSGCENLSKVYISNIENWLNIDFAYDNYNSYGYVFSRGTSNPMFYGADLYLNNQLLTEVTIPDSITTLKKYVFAGCKSLTKVIVSEGVISINYGAFYNCSNIELIQLPTSLTNIGNGAFYGCASLNSIYIPDNIQTINDYCFYGCSSLEVIDLSKNVQYINDYAFYGCSKVKTLQLSNVLKTIGMDSFYNCSSLEEVSFADSVTRIGEYAFYNCKALNKLTIGNGSISIGERAFYQCSSLTEVSMGEGTISIGDYAFNGCENIETMRVLKSSKTLFSAFYSANKIQNVYVNNIDQWLSFSFYGTTSSQSNTGYIYNPLRNGALLYIDEEIFDDLSMIPQNIISIPKYAFYGCTSLTKLEIPEHIKSLDDYSFGECNNVENIVLHTGVTSFVGAFRNCKNVASVTIPEGIETISQYAFAGCINLRSVTLPSTIKTIQSYAFSGCSSLSYINLPEGLKTIRSAAFNGCSSMIKFILPSTLATLEVKVFAYTTHLKEIINYSSKNLMDGDYGIGTGVKIVRPEESEYITQGDFIFRKTPVTTETDEDGNIVILEYGYTLVGYTGKSKIVMLPNEVEGKGYSIRAELFNGNSYITGITIPENVESIGSKAFANCPNLTRIVYNSRNATGYNSSTSSYQPFYGSGSIQGCILQIGSNVEKIPNYLFKGSNIGDIIFGDRSVSLNMGSYVFAECKYLTDITFISKINIGDYAFNNCSKLNTVILQSETNIGQHAFDNCTSLIKAELNGTISIGSGAFYNCYNLTDLKLGFGLESINSRAFKDCDGLVDVFIPEGVKHVDNEAFSGCFRLKSVTLPTTIESLGSSIFYDTPALLEVFNNSANVTIKQGELSLELDVSIVNVGESNRIFDVDGFRFQQYNNKYYLLEYVGTEENIMLPAGINGETYQIRQYAFYDLDFIKSVTIPTGVVGIGNYAFKDCDGLETLVIGADVSTMGTQAFYSCGSLKTVTIDTGLKTIGEQAFMNCSNLEEVSILEGLTKINNYAFCECSKLESILLPNGLKSIGSYAFQNCYSLQGINIPEGVTSIGNSVFYNCSSMIYATLPQGLTNIGDNAFMGCKKLVELVIPEGVTYLGISTFEDCLSMESIYIPTTVRTLGERLFYNCSKVKSITIPVGVSTIEQYTFYNCSSLEMVSIPNTVVIISKYVFYGCSSLQYVNLPERITYINNSTFENCYKLQEIIIPEGVTNIGERAFYNCKEMKVAQIPTTVKAIGQYAFYNCSALLNITIPEAVTVIENSTFSNCTSLQWAEVPETITKIGAYAFYNCSSLEWFIIPEGITTIERSTFSGCGALKSIVIPNSVTKIDDYALSNCYRLEELDLPDYLEYVGIQAFRYCSTITELYLPETISFIGNRAFDDCTKLTKVIINNAYVYERSMLMNQGRILENANDVYILKSVADSIPNLNEYMYSHNYIIDTFSTKFIDGKEYYEFIKENVLA